MKIIPGDRPDQLRCVDHKDMLLGLITKTDDQWKIELFMRVEGKASTREEAVAFAHGCWAMGEAFGLFRQISNVAPVTPPRQPQQQRPRRETTQG